MNTKEEIHNRCKTIQERFFKPNAKESDKRNRRSELRAIFTKDLYKHMFDYDQFIMELGITKNKNGTPYKNPKNLLQAVCRVLTHATDEDICYLFEKIYDGNDILRGVLVDNKIDCSIRAPHIRKFAEQFADKNKANSSNRPTETNKEFKQTERDNWIHLNSLKKLMLEAYPQLINICDKTDPTEAEWVQVLFWMGVMFSALFSRIPRGDPLNIKIQNFDATKDSYITETGFTVHSANKTGRRYDVVIPDMFKPIVKKMVTRLQAKNRDYLFSPLKGDKVRFETSKFNQTYLNIHGDKIIGKRLSINLIRKIVATHDYQKWLLNGGKDLDQLLSDAARMDHSIGVHLRDYVKTDMFDPELTKESIDIFGSADFKKIIEEAE